MSQTFAPGVAAQPVPAASDAPPDSAPAVGETGGTGPAQGPAPGGALDAPEKAETRHGHAGFWTLLVGSVGVVYGDIGTSPLYAFREALVPARTDGILLPEEVIGTVSLILWALFLIVTVKYVLILLRMDNNGEGGILSLMALARKALGGSRIVFMLGLLGASLFYGDAVITPAISVLSAVEGLKLVTPALDDYVLPITVTIIVALFLVQNRGTAKVAAFFGPMTIVWFLAMALAALPHIGLHPEVFRAANPWYAVHYLLGHGTGALVALGAVFLAVTGAEALFADLGHFGRKPIQVAWVCLVFPALALNYLGQAALVLEKPDTADPFFQLVPAWGLLPMVVLATLATVVASQAVITGAFSLSRQAIQLGLLPRLEIRHTSESHAGQIYLPQINALLMIGVVLLAVLFKTSSSLASAYGIAVTGTMLLTASMTFLVIWRMWGWSPVAAALVMLPFIVVEFLFLLSNLIKVVEGGYVPLILAGGLVILMWTWVRGVTILFNKTRKTDVPLVELVGMLEKSPPHHVRGTAVFLTSDPEIAPAALLHNLKHNKVLHEKNVILTVETVDTPRSNEADKVRIEPVGPHFFRVVMKFGYMETPNIPKTLVLLRRQGFKFDIMATSFFLSRRSIRPATHSGMPLWQDRIFITLAKNANDATDFFQIPTGRVVEVGTQVTV
ncbi:potassium transporter Kup [Methylobacterium brachiatum]|jgi:KUP system potassium uptake protein|uniref:Probable potassium transport system protein Kup n=1 Tax=Methylobacterium brachiatum TaxID=269660 RepID=A0AAJ1TX00_9HYPH|nr:potassium transporter Kup [Methylobacterium brachiatum]MCB4805242.1 potassium transporter Kup [Methylobacterium brachiatum]MDF2599124.1 putative potassium transport system protein kup 1 [Methylobacterium brachiatum]MDH2312721.1 potassium transporter Kup [Methylobacterium brachiatum]MDQ0546289.1 KUP system potassium uptake protein [Methylobacterium brachiatum]SFJ35097.1 KUP system potassium uptake protein [Methylobacterium brachiatum]